MGELFDVIIIGSGPAGLTAGVYTSRANLKTLMLAGEKWGGPLMLTTLVEDYPRLSHGLPGPAFMFPMPPPLPPRQHQRLQVRPAGISPRRQTRRPAPDNNHVK